MDPGTWGEWVAGAATFVAAGVALLIARKAERRQARIDLARGKALAWHLIMEIGQAKIEALKLAQALPVRLQAMLGDPHAYSVIAEPFLGDLLPRATEHLLDLWQLGPENANRLLGARAQLDVLRGLLGEEPRETQAERLVRAKALSTEIAKHLDLLLCELSRLINQDPKRFDPAG